MAKPVYTGNRLPSCPSCGRSRGAPWRVYAANGRVTLGCIDDYHTGHLYGESARWHNRPEAKAHRAQVKRHLAQVKRYLASLGIRYETVAERADAQDPRTEPAMTTIALDRERDYVFRHPRNEGGTPDLCPWCRRWFGPRRDAPGDYSAELGIPCPICPFPDGETWTLPQRVVRYLRNAIEPGPHANPHDRAHFTRVVAWARTGDYPA